MSKIALNVAIEIEPESKETIVRALLAHRERCLRDEPGTLQFEVLVPAEVSTEIYLFELYADASAMAAHVSGASLTTYREDVKGKGARSKVTKCFLGHELPL